MAKKHLISFMLFLISSICTAQLYPPIDYEAIKKMDGHVKSIHSSLYEAIEVNGEIVKGDTAVSSFRGCTGYYYQYNKNGQPLNCIKIGIHGKIAEMDRYKYNKQGREVQSIRMNERDTTLCIVKKRSKLRMKKFLYDGTTRKKLNLKKTEIMEFDRKGNITYVEAHSRDYAFQPLEKSTTHQFVYDENSNLLKKIGRYFYDEYLEEPTISESIYIYEYDKWNNKIKYEYIDDGMTKECETYQYDETGTYLLKKERAYSDCSNPTVKSTFIHHEDGSCEKTKTITTSYLDSLYIRTYKYLYNKDELLLSKIEYDSNDSLIEKNEYEYDAYNNVTKVNKYHVEGLDRCPIIDIVDRNPNITRSLKQIQYTYDSYGNWIQRIDFVYDEKQQKLVPSEMEIREIQYY